MIFSGSLIEHARKTAFEKELSLNDLINRHEAQFPEKSLTKMGIRGWERGMHVPKADILGQVASVLNVTVDYFYVTSQDELEGRLAIPARAWERWPA